MIEKKTLEIIVKRNNKPCTSHEFKNHLMIESMKKQGYSLACISNDSATISSKKNYLTVLYKDAKLKVGLNGNYFLFHKIN
ncbi:MAG: hypothetical protein WC393_05810 [Candidatus Nanoarchaeia archaeon]|jgi:hypothetical protein